MKIFITDKFKITKFNLPEKIEDSFLIPYKEKNKKKEKFVTIEGENGAWYLKSNGDVNIATGAFADTKVILDNNKYSHHPLKVLGSIDNVILFAMPSMANDAYKLEFSGLNSITIGKSTKCNISYKNDLTDDIHAEIKKVENDWYITTSKDDKYRTYLNYERVIASKLSIGDVIFINGLKIIWMEKFIKINNPNRLISIAGLKPYQGMIVDNTKYGKVSDEDENVDLYEEDDYFYHMPRIVQQIEPVEITIDAPPNPDNQEDLPFILTLGTSLMMVASSFMMGFSVYNQMHSGKSIWDVFPQLFMCVAMIIGGLLMPKITQAYQKRRRIKKEAARQKKYQEYLVKMDQKIKNEMAKQAQIYKENNPSTKECCTFAMNLNRGFWSRDISDEDFLRVRLGIGNRPSSITVSAPQEHFTMEEDNLQEMAIAVDKSSKTLIDVPITLDIAEQNILSFVFSCSYQNTYFDNIIAQIVSLQSALDLKIVILTNKDNASRWNYFKYLPHVFSEDKTIRFFADTDDEIKNISSYLVEEFNKRVMLVEGKSESEDVKTYTKYPPYYLIITDDYKNIKNTQIIKSIEETEDNLGFSFITISNSLKEISPKCEKFVEIGEKDSCILEKHMKSQSQVTFKNEYEKDIDMRKISVKLSNVPIMTKDGLSVLPQSLSFMEMYGVSKIEQLNIINRWQENNPVKSLSAPIGVHVDGSQFKLDLHEKFHGPHGLIAGSTGSGKSEFIITYILSMIVNYHPYEVQFVLIDYKGGGLAGAFENKDTGVRIPHLVGTITNLDTAEMNRTLVSISSELKRRQKKFNEVKDKLNESTMDIYKYQRLYREGLIDEPMAHLFIISDEFAELKSQQPEFLNELVSTARIGRSLGVHLILATQKPSGVVNDQIWSNSKFKVCLKVQDKSDSMEMLKRPEAAEIKNVGRFYLQVGYNDYFDIGQSGWGGAKYEPTDKLLHKIDDSINIIDDTGNVIKSVSDVVEKKQTEDLGEQLTNTVRFIYNLAQKENIKTKNLWLDKLPEKIYLSNLIKKYNYKYQPYVIDPIIGEYDNPANQEQGLLNLNLNDGNALIYGKSGSGKENLLATIIWSSCTQHTPSELNYYIIDCGAESLKMYNKFPHVGAISTLSEPEKTFDIFMLLDEEMERRKELYSDYGGSYKNYCENSGHKDPLIVTIVNNYEIFTENFGSLSDAITPMYRDGAKYGIIFIVTCTTPNGIRSRTVQYFNSKISLQLPNNTDYRDILGSPRNLVPATCFGRGLVAKDKTAYEFQTAFITEEKQISNTIRNAAAQLQNAYTVKARQIKSVPSVVSLDKVKQDKYELTEIPIGYNMTNKEVFKYNFANNKFNIILGNDIFERLDFIKALAKQMKNIPNVNLKIIDLALVTDKIKDLDIIRNDYDKQFAIINNEIFKAKETGMQNIYIVIGISQYKTKLSEVGLKIVNNLFLASDNYVNSNFIFVDTYQQIKKLQVEPWYQAQVNNNNGIWLGTEVGSQMAINVSSLSLEDKKENYDYMAFAIINSNHVKIKYVVDTGDNNEK